MHEFSYNNRPHKATRISPFEMNYGMSPVMPDTIGIPKKCPSAAEFLTRLQDNLRFIKQLIERSCMLIRKGLIDLLMKGKNYFSKCH